MLSSIDPASGLTRDLNTFAWLYPHSLPRTRDFSNSAYFSLRRSAAPPWPPQHRQDALQQKEPTSSGFPLIFFYFKCLCIYQSSHNCLDPTNLASVVNKIGGLGGSSPSIPILFTNGINPLGSLFYFETISNVVSYSLKNLSLPDKLNIVSVMSFMALSTSAMSHISV